MNKQQTRSGVLFSVLSIYILLQLAWWSYLLIDLNKQVQEQAIQIDLLNGNIQALNTDTFSGRSWMIVFEASFFLIVLAFLLFRTQKALRQEVQNAKQQSNFLLSITHELKTPLASSRLFLETLIKRKLPKEKQIDIISKTLKDNQRLSDLVDSLLLVSRVDSKAFELNKSKIQIMGILSQVKDQMESGIGRSHRIMIIGNSITSINLDPILTQSLFTNLVENAVKYSPQDSKVEISIEENSHQVLVQIKDYGVGLSEEEKSKVFDRFYRVGSEETRNTKGTGLGLYLVKRICQLHDIQIKVLNNTPKGSIFALSIPKQ